jgi:hypothetical protein
VPKVNVAEEAVVTEVPSMAGKRLCALASVSVLIGLGLLAIVLGEINTSGAANATAPTTYAADTSDTTDQAAPVANQGIVRLGSNSTGSRRPLPISDFTVTSSPGIAAPLQGNYGLDAGTIEPQAPGTRQ